MLIFSLQFSLTVLICFFYVKLAPHFSIAHRWLTGLEFCIPPPENELLKVEQVAPIANPKKKTGRLLKKPKLSADAAQVNKKEIELKVATIEDGTLVKHLFWEEYDELVLVVTCIVINFIVSEFWSCLSHEHNTVMTAVLLLGAFFCLKILFSVIRKLGLQSYELRIVILVGVMSFFTSFIVLEFPGNILDFNGELEKGLHEMVANLNAFLEHNNQPLRISIPIISYKLVLCGIASFMCSTIFFPSFRLARSHHEINRYVPELYHPPMSRISFFMPAFLMLLWIKPLTMDYLVPDIMSQTLFEMIRYWGIIILASIRVYLLRPYMQAFLATAVGWAELYLHDTHTKETARNIKFKILGVYSYLCVAAVQILAPSLLLLCFAFLLKSRGLPDATVLPFCSLFDSVGAFSFLCFWYLLSSMFIGIFAYFFERNQTIFAVKRKQK